MHAIKVLKEDHTRIENLIETVSASEISTRNRLIKQLDNELTAHILAEDNIFLPHVEEAIEDSKRTTSEFFEESADVLGEAYELVNASYESHRVISVLLEEVMASYEEERFARLEESLERQVGIEEKLFSKAELVLEDEDFERIGNLIEHCKGQTRGFAQAKLASSSSGGGKNATFLQGGRS